MDFDMRICLCDFDSLWVKGEHIGERERSEEFVFNLPSKPLLRNIKKRKLLDSAFSAVIEYERFLPKNKPSSRWVPETHTGLFYVVEFRNYKGKQELTLEKICEIEELEEYKIKR